MSDRPIEFSYTADRRAFWSAVSGWGMLFLLEGSILSLLIIVFAPNAPLKIGLVGLLIGGILYIFFSIFCATLRTRHKLYPDRLELNYGRDTLSIPRVNIASIERVEGRIGPTFWGIAAYDPKSKSIVATFSAHGMVALNLIEPQSFNVKDAAEPVDRIVFNVDRLEALLDAVSTDESVSRAKVPLHGLDAISDPEPALRIPRSERSLQTYGAAPGPMAIIARDLERRFGEHVAVSGLDLTVQHGEIYGFLGANGAGKTTTLKMLVGLLAPTAGEVRIAGHDIGGDSLAAKRALGYVPDRAILYDRLSGKEFLTFLAQMRGIPTDDAGRRIEKLLSLFELTDRQDSPSGSYSYGMKRKLALAGAMIHQPSVLILDEPLNGLDPRSARRLKDLFAELSREGVGILLSTHDLATAEAVCDRIGIIHRGRLLTEGTRDELTSGAPGDARPDLESVFLRFTGGLHSEPAPA